MDEKFDQSVTAVVICMTNQERSFIKYAIDSVRKQSHKCDIILVVEENNHWIDQLIPEGLDLCILRTPMCYLGKARNIGSSVATSDYIAYLDGDDIWLPNKIERQLNTIRQTGADLVGTDHYLINEGGSRYAFGQGIYIPMPSSWLIRRSVWNECPFSNDIPRSEDGDWWRRYAQHRRIVRLPEHLLEYRVRGTSLSSYAKSKKRKLFLSRISQTTIGRALVLTASCALHFVNKREIYRWHPDWDDVPHLPEEYQ